VLAHERLEQNLVNLIVRTPVVTDDVIRDRFNELRMQIIFGSLLLQVWISIGCQPFRVINLHMRVVRPEHVKSQKVHDSFFPCAGKRKI